MIDNLTEVHSHIIPKIDDGAKDIETSIKMISALKEQGAKRIILTPHYYSDLISYDDFVAKRNSSFEVLKKTAKSAITDCPTLIPAAEFYASKYVFNNDNIDEICIGSKNYVLLELPFNCSFSTKTYEYVEKLCVEYNVIPILAHIERYEILIKKESYLDDFISMGCLAQVNVSSFANEKHFVKKKLNKLLDKGKIDLIGSDCHNLTSRAPDYTDGAEEIRKNFGRTAIRKLMDNAEMITK